MLLFDGTFTLFFKDKSQKESQNSRIQDFSSYFCMMIEGSGSIPLINGSGSGRPKNMWIRWIRIQIRIRIQNTASLLDSLGQEAGHSDTVAGYFNHFSARLTRSGGSTLREKGISITSLLDSLGQEARCKGAGYFNHLFYNYFNSFPVNFFLFETLLIVQTNMYCN